MEWFWEVFNVMCVKRVVAKAGSSDEGGAFKCVEVKK